ncbi:NAD(P)-binding protein [Mycena alexandri]|uniref:NAD(P)-binding protein n=1 Tax=Mycena alexandri TaxID=1745969 RepID=A0AAD6T4V6_9AGAR|nr:NAD(P)-binding protein [Mycena alexandri]
MDLELQNVHVLITGASGGIGLETTRLFLDQGAKITAHYNTNATSLNTLIKEFGSEKIHTAQASLSAEEDVRRLFSTDSGFGPVQVLVVNHAISPPADSFVVDMTLERWQNTIDTNLTASFLVSREYLRQLSGAVDDVKAKASIVFVGSTAGKYGEAGHADYAASKSALMYGLALSLKNEIVKIAPKGRVNCVAPGWVRTPKKEEKLKDPVFVHRALATVPLKKAAEPWDIAAQVLCLASTKISGHISGHTVMVDGGMEGRLLNKLSENQVLEAL